MQLLYQELLSYEGYNVITANHGKDALEKLAKLKLEATIPKLILLDLMMPVMSGWDFLKKRDEDIELKNIPVVICSAATEKLPSNIRFIRKPVDHRTLIQIVEEFIKKS